MIGDPCYLTDEGWTGKDYDKWICETNFERSIQIREKISNSKQTYPKAVAFSTNYGDGVYPVEARVIDGRVKEVRIKLEW